MPGDLRRGDPLSIRRSLAPRSLTQILVESPDGMKRSALAARLRVDFLGRGYSPNEMLVRSDDEIIGMVAGQWGFLSLLKP